MLDLAVALLAGVATVASPCILPILPILLGASVGGHDRGRPVFIVLGFVATFSATALLFGASTRVLGVSPDTVRHAAIGALLVFGGLSIFPQIFDRLAARLTPIADLAARIGNKTGPGRVGGLAMGATLGALWTPCAGPVLASIFALIASADDPWRAGPLLVAYALGSGVPMLAIAYGGQAFSLRVGRFGGRTLAIRRAFGVAVVGVALAMIGGYDVLATASLPDFGPTQRVSLTANEPAPDFVGVDTWLNSPPLRLADLRGKVVLVDFWTYACANCVRTLPDLKRWHVRYATQGLVVVGVHTPEFVFEREPDNVRAAIRRFEIPYAVALDNGYQTWNAYQNRYWPAVYLIDREGRLVLTHAGEGGYEEIEGAIRAALAR